MKFPLSRLVFLLLIVTSALALTACGNDDDDDDVANDDDTANDDDIPVPDNAWQFITDGQGRSLTLRGVNVMSNAKGDPLRMPDITEADVERFAKDWGFNAIRFLIFWDATMPEPGVIDEAYLDRVEERLDWFADNGVQVYLDMHQDVYSRKFCCDGAPEWAIEDDGQPFELQSQWFANYFQPAVMAAWDNFMDYEGDHPELQDYYMDAWAAHVERFKDHPAVLGYDIMNEPHPGSWVDAVELLGGHSEDNLHDEFDQQRLGPFYQRVINRIREQDTETWIFFETRYGSPGNGYPSYLPVLEDPRQGENRLVFAPHLYSVALEGTQQYNPETDKIFENWERERGKDIAKQKSPMVLGEWGLDPNWEGAYLFMDKLLTMADRMMAGWSYWSYDPGGWGFIMPGEREERENADVLIRPYPRAVAGVPQSFMYDPESREFTLTYLDSPTASGVTEIYLPAERHYPEGWTLTTNAAEGEWSMTFDEEREIISLTMPIEAGKTHEVTITPGG